MPATGAVSWMKLKLSLSLSTWAIPFPGTTKSSVWPSAGACAPRPWAVLSRSLPRVRSRLTDERPADTPRQRLTNQAREDVGWTAGGKADHDPHRPRRVGLRESDARDDRQRGGACGQAEKISAGKFHLEPSLSLR